MRGPSRNVTVTFLDGPADERPRSEREASGSTYRWACAGPQWASGLSFARERNGAAKLQTRSRPWRYADPTGLDSAALGPQNVTVTNLPVRQGHSRRGVPTALDNPGAGCP